MNTDEKRFFQKAHTEYQTVAWLPTEEERQKSGKIRAFPCSSVVAIESFRLRIAARVAEFILPSNSRQAENFNKQFFC